MRHPVIQEDPTGCAIACVAFIANKTYSGVKKVAHLKGIDLRDSKLYISTKPILSLIDHFKIPHASGKITFKSWETLPSCALLAIKWHLDNHIPHWHWTVFYRINSIPYVMDPKKGLKKNIRTDFGRMNPKFYIPVSE